MNRIAFLFSGQGDQYPGMGKDLFDSQETAKALMTRFDEIRFGTIAQMFFGTEEELKETKNTQPCLFSMELAAAEVLKEKLIENGMKPECTAGFSLGEVAAAAFSGRFSLESGFRLVVKRGLLMQEEADKFDTAMAAVLKLSEEQVNELCSRYSAVYPVNFNCPGQITVSGLSDQLSEFSKAVKEAGGRVLPLKVKGAFHSPFMKRASEGFREALQEEFQSAYCAECEVKSQTEKSAEAADPSEAGMLPLYSNMTGGLYPEDDRDATIELLAEQIENPVKWEHIIRNMIEHGIDTFVEIGPGKTLTNMVKRIDGSVEAMTVFEAFQMLSGSGNEGK